ncbi:lipid II:glycine glycyltransferase FemX [Agromyces larvae]|uniref:Peptidoglycan bridge formation glycyltransferase FemA/FemB family protein n=1 Tax=Agromyces larvae TaxID=2929802 RepID=A0ABY4C2G7_9MICO|nr:peptidoglycan bridge formation glycyltransferase FemA/FemB family protein [Agromyces larvae]UOE45384.1 peptidoglycan bridge formation glycyltransferase FemA/FemB family protein [Agromyces larvae]
MSATSTAMAIGWDERVLTEQSVPHFMQSSTWQRLRSDGPWHSHRLASIDGHDLPMLAYERDVPGYGTLRHLPRVSGIEPDDVPRFSERVRTHRGEAFATKVEVHQPYDHALVAAFEANGWQRSRASQYRHAVIVETGMSEVEILSRMKKRARSEIRVAERNGVIAGRVRMNRENRERMLALVAETADRSGAFFRSADYLERVWTAFAADGRGWLHFAWHDGRVVAGAFVVAYGPNAWYKDGGSLRDRPQLMASRYLQWDVIRELSAAGIRRYDLGHVPPPDEPEAPGQGVLTFKSAFAREVTVYMPALMLPHDARAEEFRRGESAFVEAHRRRTGDYWY